MPLIFRVGELTKALKEVIEGQFPFVWVRGQVSNLARPRSGHVYFTLKDEQASLAVVWFKNAQSYGTGFKNQDFDPITGEVFENQAGSEWLADGLEVLAAGRLTVYPPRGAYQLSAELVEDLGQGKLYLEFEALKKELAEKGYFDPERKMRLPQNPRRVAVVTSPSGAAIRDFLKVGGNRGFARQVRIYPALVQGEKAPAEIARALARASDDAWAEVVVLTRGGGSLEDLWAFNTRPVAEAIFACRLPVLSAVGHEIDTTIADLVADVRAATPSHAAELLWERREVLQQRLDEAEIGLEAVFSRFVGAKRKSLNELSKALDWLSPLKALNRFSSELAWLGDRLSRRGQALLKAKEHALEGLELRLARGLGAERLNQAGENLEHLEARLARAFEALCGQRLSALELAEARLAGLNPLAPLQRGYSLTRLSGSGKLVRQPSDAPSGSELEIKIKHGEIRAVVID